MLIGGVGAAFGSRAGSGPAAVDICILVVSDPLKISTLVIARSVATHTYCIELEGLFPWFD